MVNEHESDQLSFHNPIIESNFPDPFVLQVKDMFYIYGTNGLGGNVQMAYSSDLVNWSTPRDVLPELASWIDAGDPKVWAPEVIETEGMYVLYYSAHEKNSGLQCIGVATSDDPKGKFVDTNTEPFVCQLNICGSIDSSPFRDVDGNLYLYYKNNGNPCSNITKIFVQQLSSDGQQLIGDPKALLFNDRRWEGAFIEAPTMLLRDDQYYLFYSADYHSWLNHTKNYGVGYALCDSAVGPCVDAPENPIFASQTFYGEVLLNGPGHQALLQVNDQTWMFFHAWERINGNRIGNRRQTWMTPMDWVDDRPVVRGPTYFNEIGPIQ